MNRHKTPVAASQMAAALLRNRKIRIIMPPFDCIEEIEVEQKFA